MESCSLRSAAFTEASSGTSPVPCESFIVAQISAPFASWPGLGTLGFTSGTVMRPVASVGWVAETRLGWLHAESHFEVARNSEVAGSLLRQGEEVEGCLI